jgi:DNA-directed RNA polymerase subunit RPC12/RpoP
MKAKCPKCENSVELDLELHEEGDSIECPSCGIELFVARKGKKLSLVETFEEDDEDIEGWED